MERACAAAVLAALGHEGRLDVLRLLLRRLPGRMRPGEIAGALGLKKSTLSVYLAHLSRAGLVTAERDGKALLYAADPGALSCLTTYLVADCGRARPAFLAPLLEACRDPRDLDESDAPHRPRNMLFLSRADTARGLIAEALLPRMGEGRFRAFSAGTAPGPAAHPLAIDLLQGLGFDTDDLDPKPAGVFLEQDAPRMDFVVTLCDRAAEADLPPWPGLPVVSHWSHPDPSAAPGTRMADPKAFRLAFQTLRAQIARLVTLPIDSLDRAQCQAALDAIGLGQPVPSELVIRC